MKKIYYYFYYKLYKFISVFTPVIPEWRAMIFLSTLAFLYFAYAIVFFNLFKNISLIEQGLLVFSVLSIFLVNYFLFIYKKKYVGIKREFDRIDTGKNLFYSNILTTSFIIITFLLLLY